VPPEPLLYLEPSGLEARVAAVTDDPALQEERLGPGALTDLRPTRDGGTTRPALVPHPILLFRIVDEHAVQIVQRLDWSAVEGGSVLLLRGLARRPLVMELLEALAAAGLEPTTSDRRNLGSFDGVELQVARPTGRGLASLASAHRLATMGRGLLTAPVQAPRVAVHDVDPAWVEDLDSVHAIAPGWAHDPALLREASPTVALLDHTQLDGPLSDALEAVRSFGGVVVSDRPAPEAVPGPDATLEGLPVPVPNRVFAAHQLYASQHGAEPRPPSPAELAAPDRLLSLAAAGVPLAGASELVATSSPNAEALGPVLSGLLGRPLDELEHPTAWDMHQVQLRRTAFDLAGTAAVWSSIGERLGRSLVAPPSVLVVAISSATEATERLVADHRRQRHRPRDLLLVGPAPDTLAALPSADGQMTVQADATLGDVVACARRVGADLVTLFEEGHRYGPEHLGDVARAMRLSDADLLLRPTEFVFDPVAGTVDRVEPPAVERGTREHEVAAIAARTEDLAVLDQRTPGAAMTTPTLAAALLELGARAYLTHGFGLLCDGPVQGVTTPIADHLLADLELSELLA
jgi:hypothetical protein